MVMGGFVSRLGRGVLTRDESALDLTAFDRLGLVRHVLVLDNARKGHLIPGENSVSATSFECSRLGCSAQHQGRERGGRRGRGEGGGGEGKERG